MKSFEDKNNLEKKEPKMYANTAYNTYAQNNVGVESPEKLIEMLYEGVLRFNAQMKKAVRDENIEKRTYWSNRSIAIITELINVLDMEKGQISQYLQALYQYEIQLLVTASIENRVDEIDEVSNVFKGLLEAWKASSNVAR